MTAPVSTALELSNICHDPMNLWVKDKKMGAFYEKSPVISRCLFISYAAAASVINPVLFIIHAAILSIALPIIGAIKGYKGEGELGINYIKAGALNLLGVVSVAAFFWVAAYYIPVTGSASIYIGATVACLVVRIYRASEAPPVTGRPTTPTASGGTATL